MAGDRTTGTTPGTGAPHFPGYDVMSQQRFWDDETRAVVVDRLDPNGGVPFFPDDLRPTAAALLDRLLAQDSEPRVDVLVAVETRLATGDGDGYRYEDMPDDPEAWLRSCEGLDSDARAADGRSFHELDRTAQRQAVEAVRTSGGSFHGMPAVEVFGLWMRYACDAFYSHPWAWNEIGFGGPAYPRGYANLGVDKREPWERPERAPVDPVWEERTRQARRRHADQLGKPVADPVHRVH